MSERGKELIQVSIEFEWHHPKNRCVERKRTPIIRKEFAATAPDTPTATRYAHILAENAPQICNECQENYIFKGKSQS